MSGIRCTKGELYHPKLVRTGTLQSSDSTRSVSLDFLVEEALKTDSTVSLLNYR
jgi:hypothetical protein